MFDALAIRELRLSDGALREGVLYEMEGRFRHQDVRSRTASSLANQYHIDSEQARRVLDTTMQMYEQWREQQPKLAHPQLEALLRWAAMLHGRVEYQPQRFCIATPLIFCKTATCRVLIRNSS